jgi:prepilin-type N-terminal cleavage/methylation domain-containing protein
MDRARRQAAFTLIELMITVAILGILASTAISGFRSYQLRTKRSESFMNLKSIATTENSYFATAGVFIGLTPEPGPFPGPVARTWTAAAETAFGPLGWQPEGVVFFDYDVNALNGAVSTCPATCVECFTSSAYGDTDGNGALSVIMYVKPDKTGGQCPALVTGNATPLDRVGNPIYDAPAINTLADQF